MSLNKTRALPLAFLYLLDVNKLKCGIDFIVNIQYNIMNQYGGNMTIRTIIVIAVIVIFVFGILSFFEWRPQTSALIPNQVKQITLEKVEPDVILEAGKSTIHSLDQSLQYADEVQVELSQVNINSSLIQDLLNDFENIKMILSSANSQDNSDYTVNILLQAHQDEGGFTEDAKESQAICYAILNRLRPRVVGIEGFDSDDLNLDDKINLTHDFFTSMGSNYSREQTAKVVTQSLRGLGSYQYVQYNPSVKGYGIERRSLILAHGLITHLASKDQRYAPLFLKLAVLRSDYAIARSLLILKSSGYKEITFVIGAFHGLDSISIARRYNMKVNFYVALTGSSKITYVRRMKMFENE